MNKIFLSTDGSNRTFLHDLLAALQFEGIDVWSGFNKDLEKKPYYGELVKYRLTKSAAILAIIDSILDAHVQSECEETSDQTLIVIIDISGSLAGKIFARTIDRDAKIFNLIDWRYGAQHDEFERLVAFLFDFQNQNKNYKSIDKEFINNNAAQISISAQTLSSQVDVEIDRLRSQTPNDPNGLKESQEYIGYLELISKTLLSISDNTEDKLDKENIDKAISNIRTLNDVVIRFGEWLVGTERARYAISIAHYGLFTAFLLSCGVNSIMASTVSAAVFVSDKMGSKIKKFRNIFDVKD